MYIIVDVVHIIISKHQEDSNLRLLRELNNIVSNQNEDIKMLIERWFSSLEDEGVDPWSNKECVEMANRHLYTEKDYLGKSLKAQMKAGTSPQQVFASTLINMPLPHIPLV